MPDPYEFDPKADTLPPKPFGARQLYRPGKRAAPALLKPVIKLTRCDSAAASVSPDIDIPAMSKTGSNDRESPLTPMPDAGPLAGDAQSQLPTSQQVVQSAGPVLDRDMRIIWDDEQDSSARRVYSPMENVGSGREVPSGGRSSGSGRGSGFDSAVGDLQASPEYFPPSVVVSDAYNVLYRSDGGYYGILRMMHVARARGMIRDAEN